MPKKSKLFQLVGKFEIGIIIEAENKEEAMEFAKENFNELISVDANEYNQILVSKKQLVSFKVKKENPSEWFGNGE
jgi:hypothetical protein